MSEAEKMTGEVERAHTLELVPLQKRKLPKLLVTREDNEQSRAMYAYAKAHEDCDNYSAWQQLACRERQLEELFADARGRIGAAHPDLQALLKEGLQPISLPEGKWNIPTPVMEYIRKLEAETPFRNPVQPDPRDARIAKLEARLVNGLAVNEQQADAWNRDRCRADARIAELVRVIDDLCEVASQHLVNDTVGTGKELRDYIARAALATKETGR